MPVMAVEKFVVCMYVLQPASGRVPVNQPDERGSKHDVMGGLHDANAYQKKVNIKLSCLCTTATLYYCDILWCPSA